MDFSISPDLASLRDRIEAFVEAEILPVEADRANWDAHDNIAEAPLAALRAKARAEGLWCPQLSKRTAGSTSARWAWRSATRR
jgi:acyl-CoA dehydrogenase